jgi:hypothetical protein
MLPPYWSLDKSAGLHIHKTERFTLEQLLGAAEARKGRIAA